MTFGNLAAQDTNNRVSRPKDKLTSLENVRGDELRRGTRNVRQFILTPHLRHGGGVSSLAVWQKLLALPLATPYQSHPHTDWGELSSGVVLFLELMGR